MKQHLECRRHTGMKSSMPVPPLPGFRCKPVIALWLALLSSPLLAQETPRVTIENDGWLLRADFLVPLNSEPIPGVLLLNGAARDRRAYARLASELADRGIGSLRIDLRGEGESTNRGRFEPGRRNPDLDGAERDIAAALGWLKRQPGIDSSRVGVLGASYSGEAMAEAGRAGARGAAYIALSPGSFSDQSARAIDSSGLPWWFIASRQERFAGGVVRRIPSLSRTARVTMVEGTSHASDLLSPHDNLNAEIADWFASTLTGISAPRLWGALEPGAHRVGFVRLNGSSSSAALIIDLWYPSGPGGDPMLFADYLRLSGDLRGATSGFPADSSLATTLASAMGKDLTPGDSAVFEEILRSTMAARQEAQPLARRFPLILWTPRYATTVAQSVLCEYLASHGFVVAFARPAEGGRLPFELGTVDEKRAELLARVENMRAATQQVLRLPYVDPTAMGVIGWSYTGEMATIFQQQEPRVTLVAGLSTTLLNDWVYQPPQELERLNDQTFHASYAILTQSRDSAPPPALARVTKAGYFVEMPGLAHGSFNALEGFIPSLFGITPVQRWSTSGPHGVRGYEGVGRILLRLFRHHLSGRSSDPLSALILTSGLDPATAVVR